MGPGKAGRRETAVPLKIILVAASRGRRHVPDVALASRRSKSLRGRYFACPIRRAPSPHPCSESVRRYTHASIRPSAFTGGELLAAVDELCQDFIWSSPNRLYPVQAPDGLLNRTGPAVSCKLISFAGEGRASGPNTAAATLRSGESSPQSCRTDELKMDHFMKPLAVHRTERSGVIEQGCVANRMATCLRPSSYTIPAAGRL